MGDEIFYGPKIFKLPLKARDNFTNLFDSHFETIIIVEKKNK